MEGMEMSRWVISLQVGSEWKRKVALFARDKLVLKEAGASECECDAELACDGIYKTSHQS
jgi:hypothetical protein